MTVKNLNIVLPVLVQAPDYHDFDGVQTNLRLLGELFYCKEIGTIERGGRVSSYLGVIYVGDQPSRTEIEALLPSYLFSGSVQLN